MSERAVDIAVIDEWANGQVMKDGAWGAATPRRILYSMESRAPHTWEQQPENFAEYEALVKIFCRCIREKQNVWGAFEFGQRLADDASGSSGMTFKQRIAFDVLVRR